MTKTTKSLPRERQEFLETMARVIYDECHPVSGGTPYFGDSMDYEQRLESYLYENIEKICEEVGIGIDNQKDCFEFSQSQTCAALNFIDGNC